MPDDPVPTALRARYEQAVRDLHARAAGMRRDGAPAEAIARALHAERGRLAALYKGLTPEPLRTRIRARTLRVYGQEDGPSIAFLRARGKSWEAIIASAMRPGLPVGMEPDATDAPEAGSAEGGRGAADQTGVRA